MAERIHRPRGLAYPNRIPAPGPQGAQPGGPAVDSGAGAGSSGLRAHVVELDRSGLRQRRVLLPEDADPAAPAYRMLRTQLLRQIRIHRLKMIGVVSAVDGEGKTLTATNLAMSISAEPNQTVLLVDLDLRKPSVAELLGLGAIDGLERWFEGLTEIPLFVRLSGIERLRILPTRRSVAGSSELLAAARTQHLLAELKTRYEDRIVIVDLPPVLLADDFLTVAPLLDGVLLVVSEGHTRREDVTRMKEQLGGARVLGTVLNSSRESELRAY